MCWCLPHIRKTQPQAHGRPLPLEPPSPSHPIPPFGCHRAPGSSSLPHAGNPRGVRFTYGRARFRGPLPMRPARSSRAASTRLFSASAALLPPCRRVHQDHLPRFLLSFRLTALYTMFLFFKSVFCYVPFENHKPKAVILIQGTVLPLGTSGHIERRFWLS